jgi:putative addiction module CopG family antidote
VKPELENIVNEKVASGLCNSASEVVREALRLLFEQEEPRVRIENFVLAIKSPFSDDLSNCDYLKAG